MALIHCDFFSNTLGMMMTMNVILPEPAGDRQIGMASAAGDVERGFPTLYLLHGMSDNHTAWCRRTSIERYASAKGLAVVMPNVHRSYYANMKHGHAYWDYISQEVPDRAQRLFRLSGRREDTFVAGLSMGGYGAFKMALNHPDRFAAGASLSGALDPMGLLDTMSDRYREWCNLFGDPPQVAGTESDLFAKAEALAASEHQALPLFQCCGTADFLYEQNLRYRDFAKGLGLNLTYEEHEGDTHEWGYWDRMIQRVLEWLPLSQ